MLAVLGSVAIVAAQISDQPLHTTSVLSSLPFGTSGFAVVDQATYYTSFHVTLRVLVMSAPYWHLLLHRNEVRMRLEWCWLWPSPVDCGYNVDLKIRMCDGQDSGDRFVVDVDGYLIKSNEVAGESWRTCWGSR